MKRISIFSCLLLSMFLASCTTYQYTGRQTNIRNRSIDGTEQRAGIKVDYNKRVTATSNYQLTRSDAINEAEFLCIQNEKIDVVVDPIIKIEYNPLKLKKQYKATIIGFAGKFEERPTLLDESMMYTIDDIEKFKLMYDPSFLPYFYQQPLPAGGDVYNYYIKSGVPGASVAPAKAPAKAPAVSKTAPSIMLKNQAPARSFKPFNSGEMRKAKQLRDAGIGIMVGGAATCLAAGLPTLLCNHYSEAQEIAGICLISIGAGLTTYVGIPMVCVGAARYNRMKKEQSMQFTLNAGANGIGLGLTF